MPLPDANRTIAAALYGVCVALCQPKKPSKATEGEQEAPTPEVPPSWNETTPVWREAMAKAASFMNSYCHGIDPGTVKRDAVAMALVTALKDYEVSQSCKLPYAAMVEVFVSTKQALA